MVQKFGRNGRQKYSQEIFKLTQNCVTFPQIYHVTCERCKLKRLFMLMEADPPTVISAQEIIPVVRGVCHFHSFHSLPTSHNVLVDPLNIVMLPYSLWIDTLHTVRPKGIIYCTFAKDPRAIFDIHNSTWERRYCYMHVKYWG